MSNNPCTNLLHMQVPQVPQITDNDFKVLCYLHYLDKDNKDNVDKTIAVCLENGKIAVKAHTDYAYWHEALKSPNAGIKDGGTVLIDPDKLTSEKTREAGKALKNNDIEWIKNHWRDSKDIHRNGGGNEPWYIFEGEEAYLICGIIITLAFKALFELTRHSDGEGHCSAGMFMWFVKVLSEETKDKIRGAGEKFLDAIKNDNSNTMEDARKEANKAMNQELFGNDDPEDEEMYQKLKGDFLKKIKTRLSLDDEGLSKWISNGFDGFKGFPAGDVLKKMEDRMDKHFAEKCPTL